MYLLGIVWELYISPPRIGRWNANQVYVASSREEKRSWWRRQFRARSWVVRVACALSSDNCGKTPPEWAQNWIRGIRKEPKVFRFSFYFLVKKLYYRHVPIYKWNISLFRSTPIWLLLSLLSSRSFPEPPTPSSTHVTFRWCAPPFPFLFPSIEFKRASFGTRRGFLDFRNMHWTDWRCIPWGVVGGTRTRRDSKEETCDCDALVDWNEKRNVWQRLSSGKNKSLPTSHFLSISKIDGLAGGI